METSRLLAYRFPPETAFEGRLLGMLERAFGGGPLRVLDLLLVARDAETGELMALAGRGHGEGSLITRLIGFRLDAAERARATRHALNAYEADEDPELVLRLAGAVPPGGAIAAMLVAAGAADAVHEAAVRCGGSSLLNEPVPATRLGGLGRRLVTAASSAG
jgi:hypothetical protein